MSAPPDAPPTRTAPNADPFGLVGSRLAGKYDVDRVVAEGGFGVVYRALHVGLNQRVAVKILKVPEHLAPAPRAEFFRRFANEARTLARIDHPAIVRALDFGDAALPVGGTAPWMALEWIDGVELADDLAERAPSGFAGRGPDEAWALLRPVVEAVGVAHQQGIAHRDIKPGNLMLVRGARGGARLKLLDFGIAKVMADDDNVPASGRTATRAHLQMFSLDYAAPEQVSGTRTGPWTDVHALALVLTELLTGQRPYDGDDSVEVFAQVLDRRRPTPARRGLDVGAWEPVLQRALALRPGDRHADATELLRALDAAIPSQGVWRASLVGPARLVTVSDRPPPPPAPSAKPTPNDRGDEPPMVPLRHAPRWAWIAACGAVVVALGTALALQRGFTSRAPTARPAAVSVEPASIAAAPTPAPTPPPARPPPTTSGSPTPPADPAPRSRPAGARRARAPRRSAAPARIPIE